MSGPLARIRGIFQASDTAPGHGDREAEDPGRRTFVLRAIGGIAGLVTAALGLPVLAFGTAAGWRATTPIRPLGRSVAPTLRGEGWVSVGMLDDFEIGVPKRVAPLRSVVDGWVSRDAPVGAFVLRRSARAVVAYDIHCTHLGCPLSYLEGARQFLCPCHGGQFSREGNVVAGPPPRAMTRIETRLEGDEIFLGALQEATE